MTSSNENIFRVTDLLCGEFTGQRWIPRRKASDSELWCFLWSPPEPTVEQTRRLFGTQSCSLWRHCNVAVVLLMWMNKNERNYLNLSHTRANIMSICGVWRMHFECAVTPTNLVYQVKVGHALNQSCSVLSRKCERVQQNVVRSRRSSPTNRWLSMPFWRDYVAVYSIYVWDENKIHFGWILWQ